MNSNKDDIFLDHSLQKDFIMISIESGIAEYIRFFAESDQLVWAEYVIQDYVGRNCGIIFKIFGILKEELFPYIDRLNIDELSIMMAKVDHDHHPRFVLRIPQFLSINGKIDLEFFEKHTLQVIPNCKFVTNDEIFERYSPDKKGNEK